MSSTISGATNQDDKGIYSWEKGVTDVNNIDESLGNARDLGYTRLNYARVTAVAQLGKYNEKDIYKIQVQSNGKLSISLRNTSGSDEKVLDLSKYENSINELKQKLDPEGYAKQKEEEAAKLAEAGLLGTTAPNMYIKVYAIKGNKEVVIADSTADKDSDEYKNAEALITGEYRATKGDIYIEIGHLEDADVSDGIPYALQIMQGTSHKHDYIMTQSDSSDTKNKKLSTQKDQALMTSAGGTYSISAAYAAQIQAVRDEGAANMLVNGYLNMASINNSKNTDSKQFSIFSNLLNV